MRRGADRRKKPPDSATPRATVRSPSPARRLRSIETPPPVEVERLHGGRPILEPVAGHAWESRVVLNPAADLVPAGARLDRLIKSWGLTSDAARRLRDAGGAVPMLYRAQGAEVKMLDMAPSSLGLAVFTPDLDLVHRWPDPVLRPRKAFHNLGLEDPRCTFVDGTWYVYYTGYTDPSPHDAFDRRVHICLATTPDFLEWELHGPVEGDLAAVNNKNALLVPERVDGKWLLFHRPMEGPHAMSIHLATSDAPAGPWKAAGALLTSYRYREFTRSWVGAGGPPIPLGDGRFLVIFHQGHFTADGDREYDLGAALLDFSGESPVVARIEPLMRPVGALETEGEDELGVDNVVFTCANYVWRDRVVIPYAGADSRIFGAAVGMGELVEALENV